MNKHKLFGYALRAIDDAGGGIDTDIDPDFEALLDELIEKPDETVVPDEPKPLTAQDIDALLDDKFNKFQQAQAPKEEPVQQVVQAQTPTDSFAIARRLQEVQDEIFDDIREIYADAPDEAIKAIRRDLNGFTSLDQLEAAKKQGYHLRIADSIIGNLVRENKYVPPQFRTAQQATTGTPNAQAKSPEASLSAEDKKTIDIVNSVIARHLPGKKLEREDYELSQRHLQRVGTGEMTRV